MTEGVAHTPPSSGQQGTWLNTEASSHPNYLQNDWHYTTDINDTDNHHPPAANGMWDGELPTASYYDPTTHFEEPLNSIAWPGYGAGTENTSWIPPADTLPSFDVNGPAWPLSPTDTLSTNPWSPLPSPLTETPSYILTQSPLTEVDGSNGSQPSPGCPATAPGPEQGQPPANDYTTPESPASSTFPTPTLKAQSKPKSKPPRLPPASKRPAEASAASPRPRTLKRHKSATPSTIITTNTTNNNATNPTTTIPLGTTRTTLGGVLPANVDPRTACEQIRRQAWDRCRAEAHEMAQRRTMLRGYEHGALEREMERLRVNLGVMREREREREREVAEGGRNGIGMDRVPSRRG